MKAAIAAGRFSQSQAGDMGVQVGDRYDLGRSEMIRSSVRTVVFTTSQEFSIQGPSLHLNALIQNIAYGQVVVPVAIKY
jgi:hypothetical protein